jgi:predicted deacylase
MGILPESYREVPEKPTRILEVGGFDYFVYASTDGVFEPLSELGDTVRKDQPAARIHFPDTPWREPEMLHFKRDGFLLCKRSMGRVMRGDCVFHLGTDSNL